nr:immunoglobulin heavy chain junction region [Macaca mulatta]MPN71448.1 immunoglobulin heavy chain junction region [Macaca mulatta]MPN72570.1 immunoglobulin heavy chain junction region [Macaca mulatta]MPN77029.1 immunoglobulin heavy chain junction region [Macaca mulatta]MPN77985.1 immunoglobulin heavy chain junction region [Macaca mulatta]
CARAYDVYSGSSSFGYW